jgi:hypothetical protein
MSEAKTAILVNLDDYRQKHKAQPPVTTGSMNPGVLWCLMWVVQPVWCLPAVR